MVPTSSFRHMDQLFPFPQCISTVGSPEIAKGSVVPFFFSPLTVSFASHSHALFLIFVFPFLSPFPFFFFYSFFFLLSFLSPLTHRIFYFLFYFLQVRGSFLSLYYSFSMCHMDTCSKLHSPHHMALIPCVLLTWCHVEAPGHAMWQHPMCHPTPGASKNVKF